MVYRKNVRSVSSDKKVRCLIVRDYGGKCAATRKYVLTGLMVDCNSRRKLEIDHKHELHNGGLDEYNNLQPLCKKCHSKKTTANRKSQVVWRVIPFY